MRVLWLKSDYIVPPDTGGKIRTFNLLRGINALCPVTYASLKPANTPNDEPAMRECASEIFTVYRPEENKSGYGLYARALTGTLSSAPYIAQKYRCRELRDFQARFSAKHNDAVIVCDFLEMTENVNWNTPAPKILFQHNVETMIWRRYHENERNPLKKAYFNYEAKRMAAYESDSCNRFDRVFVVSECDARTLRDEFGVRRPIDIIETGVDADFFSPRRDATPIPGKLVFTGSMDWMPNIDGIIWFVEEVYPLIRRESPQVTLDIVGRRPTPFVRALAERDSSITVTGDVPDVRPYLAQGHIVIVPLRVGGGTRLKIYEAMAMGRPVLSTTIGAEGLPLTAGHDILIADTPAEFAREVNSALRSPDTLDTVARAGYHTVTERYRWPAIARRMLTILTDTLSANRN